MFNIESMIDLEDKMPDIMKMNLCANWFGSLSRGGMNYDGGNHRDVNGKVVWTNLLM